MLRPRAIPLVVAVLAGCAGPELSYSIARGEFDSVTGHATGSDEAAGFAFRADVDRWPWTVRLFYGTGFDWLLARVFGLQPSARGADNPSGVARGRLAEMAGYVDLSLGHLADVAERALWVAARDPQPLDQAVAVESLERVLAELGIDPLESPVADAGGEATVAAIDADLRVLESAAPWRRAEREPSAPERRRALASLQRAIARPHPSAELGRRLTRFLHRAAVADTDPSLRQAWVDGLATVVGQEASRMLRIKLTVSDELGVPRDDVRRSAILAIVRLAGPRAVPWIVHQLVRSGAGRLDSSEHVRRLVVRLCAALPAELVDVRVGEGPSPIEFLYDVVKRDDLAGLRTVALEALAICLGRDTSHDPTWADAYWQERALRGAGRAP